MQTFLADLERQGDLCRVSVEVDPILEIAALTDRVCKMPHGGKALLFEQVNGSNMKVATNLFGSWSRLATAFGVVDTNELAELVKQLFHGVSGNNLAERSKAVRLSDVYSGYAPKLVTNGCCQEVVEIEPDLASLPLLKNWPDDGFPNGNGRAISLPLVFTVDPTTGISNCGIYRVEQLSGSKAALHWRPASGGARHYAAWQELDRRMPIAIALGGDPLLSLAASFPLPEPLEELYFAGYLRGKPINVVRCLTNELLVPATAELVIEGYLQPGEQVQGGSFGNHSGYYIAPGLVPIMEITCISHRNKPIFPATVIGPPPMEDCYLAKVAEQMLLPVIRQELPEIVAINLPMAGIFHGCALIAINKMGPDHPREVLQRLWQGKLLGAGRLLLILDAETDLQDLAGVAWRTINRVNWQRDLVSPDEDEFAANSEEIPFAGRLGIDATRKSSTMPGGKEWPKETSMSDSILATVTRKWRQYGVL